MKNHQIKGKYQSRSAVLGIKTELKNYQESILNSGNSSISRVDEDKYIHSKKFFLNSYFLIKSLKKIITKMLNIHLISQQPHAYES